MTSLVQLATPPVVQGSAEFRLFASSHGDHLFMTDGSQVYDIDAATRDWIAAANRRGPEGDEEVRQYLGLGGTARAIRQEAPPPPALHSVSLNIAQACNLHCGYCYADEGKFAGNSRLMDLETAKAAADCLIAGSEPGSSVVLGFIGGEPLLNRPVLHAVTRYAAHRAALAGKDIQFSITTNATLLCRTDAELFHEFPFCVQISIDGSREQHDAARPLHDRSGSYALVLRSLELLEREGRPRELSARATVTPRSGRLLETLDHLLGLGFDNAGFAPVVVSPDAAYAFGPADFHGFLAQMIECGEKALSELLAGRIYAFSNFHTALNEIYRGTHRPYPCGAGAGYLSAGAEGGLFACHRLIDDDRFAMGDVRNGPDRNARTQHLKSMHVDRMEPCRGCWARYLCGGGCYHEVTRAGRPACDYVRGWIEFCLRAYAEVSARGLLFDEQNATRR